MIEIQELRNLRVAVETVINEKPVSPETVAQLSAAYDKYRDAALFEEKLKGRSEDERKHWLTEQQAVVLRMRIADGKSYLEIADQLRLTEITVKNHAAKALRKLRHHDKRDAVLHVVESFATKPVKEKFKLLLWA
jgi:DNA-binding NarL/FixJ family response regulator